jgi:hypothetical protein
MQPERRNQIVLAVVLVVLAITIYRAWSSSPAVVAPTLPSGATPKPQATSASRGAVPAAPDVHLRALEEERPKPVSAERNLFKFKPKPPPPPPPPPPTVEDRPPVVVNAPPPGPPPVPPPPPIAMKFIGVVEGVQASKIAVLSDGRNVFHGREGDVIEGRYRILRIGAESIEMAYLDGRGRQTIRLTGS